MVQSRHIIAGREYLDMLQAMNTSCMPRVPFCDLLLSMRERIIGIVTTFLRRAWKNQPCRSWCFW